MSVLYEGKSLPSGLGEKKLHHILVESACPALTLWFNYSCNLMSFTDACFFFSVLPQRIRDRFLHYLVLLQNDYLEPEEKMSLKSHMELSHLLDYRALKGKKT